MAGYFYAFADHAAAVDCGALSADLLPTQPEALILRDDGIALVPAELELETGDVVVPAVMSLPLVILSPTMIPGCSDALIVPPGHAGFA